MDYLEKCWASHLGIVITPDIIWYTLLCEIATIVKSCPKDFRKVFTTSSEKKEIIIPYTGNVISLQLLVEALKKEVPTETSYFFPDLNFTKNSQLAFQAAFCDTCSPFYNYGMLLCGFPFIKVEGSIEDWKKLKEQWNLLRNILKNKKSEWQETVSKIFDMIINNFDNIHLWQNFFSIQNCGSGHQTSIIGWFSNLFVEIPKVPYSENFSTHISTINYKIIDTVKKYEMNVGLFNSVQQDEFMVPSFSSVTYDVSDYTIYKNYLNELL